jgi:hypothetical protein
MQPGSWGAHSRALDTYQVTEETQVDLSQGRVAGEEYLREHGATCLVLAGIYGDERQPSSWLLRGTT